MGFKGGSPTHSDVPRPAQETLVRAYNSAMRIVGKRKLRPISRHPSAELLAESARFSQGIERYAEFGSTFIPKGVYRFATLEEADAHRRRCLTDGMARLAAKRR